MIIISVIKKCLEILFDFQKGYKNRASSCTAFSLLPWCSQLPLPEHGDQNEEIHTGPISSTELWVSLRFHQNSHSCPLSSLKSRTALHLRPWICDSSYFSLAFHDVALLRSPGHSLECPQLERVCSLVISLRVCILGKKTWRSRGPSVHTIEDVSLGHWDEALSVSFSHCQIISFTFLSHSHLKGQKQ